MIAQIKDVNQMKFLSFILAAVMSISVFAGGLFLKSTQKKEADSNGAEQIRAKVEEFLGYSVN